jgi:sulfite reductase alpha subunit-like flavoprotein
MAKDVERALLDAIATGAQCSPEQAVEYLTALKAEKRYRRDVY